MPPQYGCLAVGPSVRILQAAPGFSTARSSSAAAQAAPLTYLLGFCFWYFISLWTIPESILLYHIIGDILYTGVPVRHSLG